MDSFPPADADVGDHPGLPGGRALSPADIPAQADAFVADHKNWIARHLDEARRRTAAAPPPPAAADIAALKERARQVLAAAGGRLEPENGAVPHRRKNHLGPKALWQLQRDKQSLLFLLSHEQPATGH